MSTNRNTALAERSAAAPARYNRQFARSQWRQSFVDGDQFKTGRAPRQRGSFRHFTGRTANP
jgi:hypothetical protein